MLDFTNTEIAFASKSDAELRSTKLLFEIMKNPSLVKIGKRMSQFAIAIRFPIGWAVKPTIYKHFVGGETLEKCAPCVANLMKYNVLSTLDYSAEGAEGEFFIKRTFDETMRSIENASRNKSIAYTVFKPTAITRFIILEKKSSGTPFTPDEQREFDAYCDKMNKLAEKAHECGVRLLVDAEHYATQQAIDDVTNELMTKYNKQRAIIFNTLQMYRHDRYAHLVEEHKKATEQGYIYGVKFVRGAYMDAERERAITMNYPDPICANKQATDDNFNAAVAYSVEHINNIEMFCGTHNELSNMKLAEAIDKAKLEHNDKRIFFAQLYGMSDNISFSLANAGYNVTKYVPYGPMQEVLPYLIRRAQENTMVEGQTLRELTLIDKEYNRRKNINKG